MESTDRGKCGLTRLIKKIKIKSPHLSLILVSEGFFSTLLFKEQQTGRGIQKAARNHKMYTENLKKNGSTEYTRFLYK